MTTPLVDSPGSDYNWCQKMGFKLHQTEEPELAPETRYKFLQSHRRGYLLIDLGEGHVCNLAATELLDLCMVLSPRWQCNPEVGTFHYNRPNTFQDKIEEVTQGVGRIQPAHGKNFKTSSRE